MLPIGSLSEHTYMHACMQSCKRTHIHAKVYRHDFV